MSRYDTNERIIFKGKITIFPETIDPKKEQKFILYTVKPEENGRPDIISINNYGNPHNYYLIMRINGFDNWNQIKTGMTIKIPVLIQ
jgi:hypothetical protein